MAQQYDISPEELEEIEAYLDGTLDGNALQLFEQRIGTDPVFERKVAEVRQLTIGIAEAALQQKLPAFHALVSTPGKTVPLYRRWWVAASVLLIAAAASWLLWPRGDSNERLYSTYFSPDMGLPVTMGSDSANYLFNDGMISYKEEQYATALSIWEKVADAQGDNDTLRYYRGMAQLNQQHIVEAERLLIPVSTNESTFADDATWYLALIRLRSGDRTTATELLKRLPQREEARTLLEELAK